MSTPADNTNCAGIRLGDSQNRWRQTGINRSRVAYIIDHIACL